MFDMKKEAKKKVLEEIMKLMDEDMGQALKSKSPKFMSVEVEATDAKPLVEKMDEEKPEGELEEMKPEMEMASEEMPEGESDEDKERLLELYRKLC